MNVANLDKHAPQRTLHGFETDTETDTANDTALNRDIFSRCLTILTPKIGAGKMPCCERLARWGLASLCREVAGEVRIYQRGGVS